MGYDVWKDFIDKDYFKNTPQDRISISLQKKVGNMSADLIMLGQDIILLDKNMNLNLFDIPFKDTIKGNEKNDTIISLYGMGRLFRRGRRNGFLCYR